MTEEFKEYTIYKIECKDPEVKHLYVGSTENYEKRVGLHKNNCNNEVSRDYNIYVYRKIREYGGFDNWKFEILEKVVCTKEDARKLEEEYRVKLKADLNSCKCYIDLEEKEIEEFYKMEEKRNKYEEEYEKKAAKQSAKWKKYREEHKEYYEEYKKYYKKREKERKMEEFKTKSREFLANLKNFNKFPTA